MLVTGKPYKTDKYIPKDAKYADRYIAFLDILGFSEIIQESIKDNDLQYRINSALTSIYISQPSKYVIDSDGQHINLPQSSDGIRAYVFSDNILVSAPFTPGGLNKLMSESWKLFGDLLYNCSVLLRGAIVKGRLYDDGQIAYGPGLIEAYKAESDMARYPRIMLSSEVAAEYKKNSQKYGSNGIPIREYDPVYEKEMDLYIGIIPIIEDFDGIVFIDVISCIPTWLEKYVPNMNKREVLSHEKWVICIRDFAERNIGAHKDEKIQMKYDWLRRYYNQSISTYSKYTLNEI